MLVEATLYSESGQTQHTIREPGKMDVKVKQKALLLLDRYGGPDSARTMDYLVWKPRLCLALRFILRGVGHRCRIGRRILRWQQSFGIPVG
jgi:hypothetical protein